MNANTNPNVITSKDKRVICIREGDYAVTFGWRPTDCPASMPPYELSRVKLTDSEWVLLKTGMLAFG